ncbi:MAG: thioredoxin family protein [Desulfobulbaceae bacterium]|nr:thioredoxin family protein [Desulfobulbaceae bacterium]
MEAATSRTIRIGAANIGLIGLDIALNRAATEKLSLEKAVESLYVAVSKNNYIPSGMEDTYRQALLNEYKKHMGEQVDNADHLVIRVFGSGCISCNKLQSLVIEALNTMELAVDIEQIHDPDEIGRHGILHTPALMINKKVMISGRMPTPAQIEGWIREQTDPNR